MTAYSPQNNTTSPEDRTMAAIGYWGSILFWFLPALVIFVIKKDQSAFVKKHALQSLVLNLVLVVAWIALSISTIIISFIVPFFGFLMMPGLVLGSLVYFIYLGYQTFQGEDPDVPMLTRVLTDRLGI